MSGFQICLCGQAPGYPHTEDCPRPLYHALPDSQAERAWNEERAAKSRGLLERYYGKVWSSDELRADFEVLQFAAPLVVVQRKSDKKLGSLRFQAFPRFYYAWKED